MPKRRVASDWVSEQINQSTCHYCGHQTLALTSNIPSPRYYAIECVSVRCGARGPLRRSPKGAYQAWAKVL